jgi:hypothetical protein
MSVANNEWPERGATRSYAATQKKEAYMAEEHEARQPYKCAVCGSKFDSQQQLQEHLKSCTKNK